MPVSSVKIALDKFTTFGDLLKYLRRRAGVTQRELSIAVGYSDTQISRLEQNERLPDLATLTARFLPALHAEDHPEVAVRLMELAAAMRREDAPATGLAPYKGLYYFDESDTELFFGRETLTARLMEKLLTGLEMDQRFLAVVGASGSGKSSVVRAGLIPALLWQQPSSGWPVYTLTPTAHPLESLAENLSEDRHLGQSARKILEMLEGSPNALNQTVELLTHSAGAQHALLVIDQFEELFTLCRSEAEQAAFVENLLTAATHSGGCAIVVIVLRADFYAHCSRFDLLRQCLAQYQEYIGPMTREELSRAIEEPARRGHWEIEPGLVEILLHDLAADSGHTPEPGALPLLSHALLETWQRRRGRILTISGYIAAGGVRSAIAETAEAVFFDQLEPQQRPIARQIFLRLTELGGDSTTADTRRRVSYQELAQAPEQWADIREVLNRLADARLITTDQNTAEVAHEALIREWPTLRGWLEEDREGLRMHRHLTEAALEWESHQRDPDGLYRGVRLAQAREWAGGHSAAVSNQEHEFLDASQVLAEQENLEREAQYQRELEAAQQLAEVEKQRAEEQTHSTQQLRKRSTFLAFATLAAILLAGAAILFGQRANHTERLATSRELAAAAVSNLQIDPERSVLLALQALENADTLEARNALHQALPELHLLLTIPSGHTGGAAQVSYNPDGTRLVSIGPYGDIKVWNAATGEQVYVFVNETGNVGYSAAFSPNGKLLAAALDTEVVILDAVSGEKMYSLAGHVSGAPNNEMVHLSFSPDGQRLAIANLDGTPKIFDLSSRSMVLALVGHQQPCDGIAFSPDGIRLATSDDAGMVKTWDAVSGLELLSLTQSGNVHSVAFSPDSKNLAAASEDGTLLVWDAATGSEVLSLRGHSGMYGVAFMPDGKGLVTGGQDGAARIYDAVTGQALVTLAGNTSTVTSVTVSPDGMRIASSGYDGTLKIWDTAPGREQFTIQAHTGTVWDLDYSPDGSRLGTVGEDGTIKFWDAVTGQAIQSLSVGGELASLAFSPDGGRLAVGGANGMVYLLDSKTGQAQVTLPGHTYLVFDLAFSPDGNYLATSSWDETAKLWDLTSGEVLQTFSNQWSGLAFSPDGKSLFTVGLDRYVHQWNTATGQELQKFADGSQDVYGIAVSPDGFILAVGQQDGAIILWDVKAQKKLHTLSGHAGLVARLAFRQDGTRIASASFDRLAKVWDVASGEELFSLYGNRSNVYGIALSPDGKTLATAGADGTMRTFNLQIEDLVALAKIRITRALSEPECMKFLHQETCP